MVIPPALQVVRGVVDVRAEPRDESELVDQLHLGEYANVLARRAGWAYVQAWDHYFGWIPETSASAVSHSGAEQRVVCVPVAEIHDRPERSSAVVGVAPAGTWLPAKGRLDKTDWLYVTGGWVERSLTVRPSDLPHRPPTAADLLATAQAFIGVPYLWGGTSALGIDCSGYVQQVYRLNGIHLDRDADQQAMEGREVGEARAGDLLFFGDSRVTHVGIATGDGTFLDAPEAGFVGRHTQGSRTLRAIRRYLPDGA
jgi:cell wall-associated NlpC family hydrolase